MQSSSLTPTCALLTRNSREKLLTEKKSVQNLFPSSVRCYKLIFIFLLPSPPTFSLSFLLPPLLFFLSLSLSLSFPSLSPSPLSPSPLSLLPLSLSFPPSFPSTSLYLLDFSDQLGRPAQCGFKAEPEEYEMVFRQWVYTHLKNNLMPLSLSFSSCSPPENRRH